MNFLAIITRSKKRSGGQGVELLRERFEAPSITAAKSKITKIANDLVYLEGVVQWDTPNANITGKDLRWKAWDTREPYTQKDGTKVGWSGKLSGGFSGNYDATKDYAPYYSAWVTLYWEIEGACGNVA